MDKLTQRSLVYDEGTSDKFWSIRVDGLTHTVHYGRVGTAGQVKAKAFDTGDAAVAAAEKLIDDKLRKGYRDAGQPREMPDMIPAEATRAPVAVEVVDELAPAPVAPVPIADDVRPALDLLPHEWSLATWRPLHEAPAAAPRPFDPKLLREALRAVSAEQARWGWWTWPSSPISFPMTREEAAYWLRLGQGLRGGTPLKRHAAVLEQGPDLAAGEAIRLARECQLPEGEAMAPLVTLLGSETVLELLLTPRSKPRNERPALDLFAGVRPYLMPLLSAEDQDRLRARAHDWLEEELRDPEYVVGDAATLAAQVGGLHEQVEELCGRWPDGWFSESGGAGSYASIAFGAGSADAFETLVDRTKMRFTTGREVAGWLAHTELRRLDWLVTSALRQDSRDAAASAMGAIAARVHAVEAAPAMLELQMSSRAPSVAREWLNSHPAQTARGLIPLLARSGQLADAARDELKRMARGPARPLLEDLAGELADPDRTRLQQRVLDAALPTAPELEDAPDWLDDATGRIKQVALPAWLDVTALPSLDVDGGSLGPRHLPAVLRLLRTSDAEPDPGLADIRRSVSPASTEEFAWALFDAWMTANSPSKDKWALLAMGHIGGDHCATRLAPLIRVWPGESQHKRAVLGLDVLRGIGSDVALMQLNGIAQKLKFKALQARAREAMEEIARAKGMTKGELEDRIVPDCGLDEHGQRVFDFGPRQFEFVLGPGMKPMLRDGAGKLRTSPPKPGAKDDEALATAAVADWKLMRKTVADVAKVQGARLEQAMVGGRRWSREDFETLLVGHPLQRHLVRLLVLATYRDGAVSATFRLTEEGDYADSDDEPFALADHALVGIVHPMHLGGSQAEWGEILADYEIVPPFPQLGRPVYDVEPDELDGGPITRFGAYRVAPGALVRILENLEWSRGVPQDAGLFYLHSKYFPGADCTAVLQYEDGIPTGYIMEAESQKLEHLYMLKGEGHDWDFGYGLHGYRREHRSGGPMRWRDVDPVVRSEVLSDVHHLVAKAES